MKSDYLSFFVIDFIWFFLVLQCNIVCLWMQVCLCQCQNSFMSLIIKKIRKKGLWLEIFNFAVSKANTTTVWHWNVLLSACYANLHLHTVRKIKTENSTGFKYTSHFYTFLVLVCLFNKYFIYFDWFQLQSFYCQLCLTHFTMLFCRFLPKNQVQSGLQSAPSKLF